MSVESQNNFSEGASVNDMLHLRYRIMKREMKQVGVLDVELGDSYNPQDASYEDTEEGELYAGFIDTHSFVPAQRDNFEAYDGFDLSSFVARRFDNYVDVLPRMFQEHGDNNKASIARGLTMEGAASYAKDRYYHYLLKFIDDKEMFDRDYRDIVKTSKDVTYWMWAHLTLSQASQLPSLDRDPDLDPNLV